LVRALAAIPAKLRKVLAADSHILAIAKKYYRCTDFLYLGRQFNFLIALEGTLKLKELSYVHAEDYPSAEMKHGPIAMIAPEFPSLFVVPRDAMFDKNMSNMEEIKARKGPIIAVATAGDTAVAKKADDVIYVPATLDCPTRCSPWYPSKCWPTRWPSCVVAAWTNPATSPRA